MTKTQYFALYDYGQGGLWMLVAAESAARIREKYPWLQVFEGTPPMLDESALALIRSRGVQDIDDPPSGWLADLVQDGGGAT